MLGERDIRTELDTEDGPGFDEIEAAYLRALEVADAVESVVEQMSAEVEERGRGEDVFYAEFDGEFDALAGARQCPGESTSCRRQIAEQGGRNAECSIAFCPLQSALCNLPTPLISAAQVLEALLFVGGGPLSGRKLGELLGSDMTPLQVEELIDDLNQRYAEQGRPYEVRLVEGGYEMVLRPEFEPVRSRVYGQGPKEVKLSQDVLEVLAFVAYRQPVTLSGVLATGKQNAAAHLRQLLRRQLIELRRGDEDTYHTTPRFLQLFGLGDLDDLPQAVDFDFK